MKPHALQTSRALVAGLVLGLLTACGSSPGPAGGASLAAGGSPGGATGAGGTTTPKACTEMATWPSAALPATDATLVDATQFIPQQQLHDWGYELDSGGLRATGSAAHQAYVDRLVARLNCAGVQDVHTEDVPLTLWEAQTWGLSVTSGTAMGPVKVASYGPFTGPTTAQGVTAPLVYFDATMTPSAANAKGKIVLFDVGSTPMVVGEFAAYAMGLYQTSSRVSEQYQRPFLGISNVVTELNALQAAGAAGAIAISPAGYAAAYGSYYPYDGIQRSVPTLFVDKDVGAQLKTLAGVTAAGLCPPTTGCTGPNMNLVLTANVAQATARNIVGMIPGASDELTVMHSHTDGTNSIEDNGPDAVVGIAQYLTRLPKSSLPRSVMILLSAGHFTGGSGIRQFLAVHKADGLTARIASITTAEHLGAQDWEPDANGVLQYANRTELGAMFMPQVQALADASYDWFIKANAGAGAVLKPTNASGDGTADNAVWPGEGQYFYGLAKIPTANYITGPNYLLNWGITSADKTDYDRERAEMIAFAQMQLDLSRQTKTALSTEAQNVVTTGTGKYGTATP